MWGCNLNYRFGKWELNAEHFELLLDGTRVQVEPRVFDLLLLLAANDDRVITKNEIIESVWGGRIVSEATISTCVKSARQAIGDDGKAQQLIRTVHGRGFRFVGKLEKTAASAPVQTPEAQTSAFTMPALIILPMQVFGSSDLEPFADGLVENLTTILTRIPLLSILSRTSSFALKGKDVHYEDLRERFGVKFMLEGSLQPLPSGTRVNLQLIDTASGFHLWAQQFDFPASENLLEQMLERILPRLEPQLWRAIMAHLTEIGDQGSSRQALLQAVGLLSLKGWHTDTFAQSTELLRMSIAEEPGFALSHAYLALTLALGHRIGLLEKSHQIAAEAMQEAEKALELDGMDSNVVGLAACALADIGHVARAIPLLRNAVEINPNNAQAWSALGSAELMDGQTTAAIGHLEHGIAISPMDGRLAVWGTLLALAYLNDGKLDQALQAAQNACMNDVKTYLPRLALAATHLVRIETEQAAKALVECYRINPDLSQTQIDLLLGSEMGSTVGKLRAA